MAIGNRLGEIGKTGGGANPEEPTSQVFEKDQVATLEVTPSQAETLLQAGSSGRLALILRSVADFAETVDSIQSTSQTVKLVRYGQAQTVSTAAASQNQPSAAPAMAESETQAPASAETPAIEVR